MTSKKVATSWDLVIHNIKGFEIVVSTVIEAKGRKWTCLVSDAW